MIGRILFACAAGAAILPGLCGCAVTQLSTAASMRVEVEVYKGPLAKEPEIQWADLVGLLAEADSALAVVGQAARDNMRAACDASDLTRLTEMHDDIISAQRLAITSWANACAWNRKIYGTNSDSCIGQGYTGSTVESVRKTGEAVEAVRKATEIAGKAAEATSKATKAASSAAEAAINATDPGQAKKSARQATDAATQATEAAHQATEAAGKAAEAASKATKAASGTAEAAINATDPSQAKRSAGQATEAAGGVEASDAASKAEEAASTATEAARKADAVSEAKDAEKRAKDIANKANEETEAKDAASKVQEATRKVQDVTGEAKDAANKAREAASKAREAGGKAIDAAGKTKNASATPVPACKAPGLQTIAYQAARMAAERSDSSRQEDHSNAKIATQLSRSASAAQADREALKNILAQIARVSQQFKLKASLWSEANVPYGSQSVHVRRVQITLTTLLGTYADRMGSKADTLLKQVKGNDRQELALSVSLRETNPPAYLKQFVWYDAGGNSMMQDLQASNGDETRARVRGVERLYADENWSNVNTVYASGQGTVRMALIKDDIGNWNLKSFDSDPSKLLEAYKNVGLAGAKVATELAIKAGTGVGGAAAATQALEMANKFALGAANVPAPTVGSKYIEQLHADTAKRLTALQAATQNRATALIAQIKKLTAATQQGSPGQKAAKAYDDAKASNDIATNDLVQASADEKANSEVRDQLDKDIAAQPDGSDDLKLARAGAQTKVEGAQKRKTAASDRSTEAKAVMSSNETAKKQFDNDKKMLDSAQRDYDQLPMQAVDQAKLILDGYQSVVDALESALVSDDTTGSQPSIPKIPSLPK